MKKTLIALMALAGVACGVDVTSSNVTIGNTEKTGIDVVVANSQGLDIDYATYPNTTINTIDDKVNAWALYYKDDTLGTENASLTLNVKGTLSLGGSFQMGTHDSYRAKVNTTITDAELTTLASDGFVSRWVVTDDHINNFNRDKISLTLNGLNGYADGGVIFDCNGTYYASSNVTGGTYVTVTDTTKTIALDAHTAYTVYKIAAVSNAAIKGIGFVVVPEPATATLSLLALAGLAARRRRK